MVINPQRPVSAKKSVEKVWLLLAFESAGSSFASDLFGNVV